MTGLRVAIGGSRVLAGVDLRVPAGRVTALLGRNGVGKTTTLRSLIGLLPSAGDISVLGHRVSGWPTHRIIRLGVGYVPEDRDVFAGLSVRENLRIAETGPDLDYDRVYDLFPELRQRSRQLAGTLSGGQQQMVAIGRVLLADRPLLLVESPPRDCRRSSCRRWWTCSSGCARPRPFSWSSRTCTSSAGSPST